MRLDQVRQALSEQGVDGLLVSQPENRRYLSGFTGSAGYLLISPAAALLATDFRYYEQVGRQAPHFELARIKDRFADLLPGLVRDLGIERLGFEAEHMTFEEQRLLSAAAEVVTWVPLKKVVEKVRAVKDDGEVEAIRRSVAITDSAFAHFLTVLRPGMTERQAAWEIEKHMREQGADKVAFDPIVASGPNGALPHARPGDRPIAAGEPIVVDIGASLDGYASDMTRTVCLGQPSARYLEVWQIVLRAQETAKSALRAGLAGREADAIAREVIVQAGYGDYFGHGLGHGVGLAVHESPGAGRLSEDILKPGNTLTVEPGIYLPGEFGVRIEDLVVIREEGIDVLTGSPKEPVVY